MCHSACVEIRGKRVRSWFLFLPYGSWTSNLLVTAPKSSGLVQTLLSTRGIAGRQDILLISSLLSFDCHHSFRDSVLIFIVSFIQRFCSICSFCQVSYCRTFRFAINFHSLASLCKCDLYTIFPLLYLLNCMAGWLHQQIHILTMTYVTSHFANCLPAISQLSSSFVSELELLDYLFFLDMFLNS